VGTKAAAGIISPAIAANGFVAVVLSKLMDQLLECTALAAWADDSGRVKQARIGARRMREALQLFGPRLHPKRAKQLVRELEVLAAPLDQLRELDVVLDLLDTELRRRQPVGDAVAETQDETRRLVELLRTRRVALAAKAARRLAPARLRPLASRLGRYARGNERLLIETLKPRLHSRCERLERRADQLDAADLSTMHALRRAARRVRYDLEALAPWLDPKPELLTAIRSLQDHLGAITDREAVLSLLDAETGPADPDDGLTKLRQRLHRQIDKLLARTPRAAAPLHESLPKFDGILKPA